LDALSFLDFLVEPTFIDRNNPPLKVNVSAKVIGIIAVVLSALGLLFGLIAIPAVFLIGSAITALGGYHQGILVIALIGLLLALIADVMSLVGGWQMYQGNHNGRRLLIHALALSVAFNLIYTIGTYNVGGFIFTLIINAIVYYFVLISRFPDEAPLVASAGGAPPMYPPQQPPGGSPPQQPPGGYPPQQG
jgi:MFS family permease